MLNEVHKLNPQFPGRTGISNLSPRINMPKAIAVRIAVQTKAFFQPNSGLAKLLIKIKTPVLNMKPIGFKSRAKAMIEPRTQDSGLNIKELLKSPCPRSNSPCTKTINPRKINRAPKINGKYPGPIDAAVPIE
jgi:hypothetical protein